MQQKLRQVSLCDQKLQENNSIVSNMEILKQYPGFKCSKQAYYVPYNHIYKDIGWGCAWRAIQMVLSSYYQHQDLNKQGKIDFYQLFKYYGLKNNLVNIVKNTYNNYCSNVILKSKFAPIQHASNWAQPFICHLICKDKNIKSRLFLLNGYPTANSPRQAFQQRIINFPQFIKLVDKHIQSSPIMIDDGYYSMNILAYKNIDNKQHEFIMGDPHIKCNINNQLKTGIYRIVLDQKGHKTKQYIEPQILMKQAYCDNMTKIDFQNKYWMILVTQKVQNI